jgi:hypothetical protein
MRNVVIATILGVAIGAGAAPAEAASPNPGGGWLAWFGCWEPVGEDARGGTVVCVLPGERATDARIVTWVDGERTAETLLHADGVARTVEEGGCVGSETARWSSDGRRVYVRSEFDCGGLGRVSTGVLGMVGESEWIDAQALTVAGQHAARSVRYRAVEDDEVPAEAAALLPADRRLAQQTARLELSQPLGVDAIVEATRLVAPPALEALLAASGHGFAVDATLLRRLARENLPASTIDMIVALAHPERFAVRDRALIEDAAVLARADRRASDDVCYDTFFMRPAYGAECRSSAAYRYSRYGYGSRFGYSPWGYDPYGWYPGRDRVIVIVEPGGERNSNRGEVVKGRGYVNPNSGSSTTRSGTSSQPSTRSQPAARGSSSNDNNSSDSRGSSTGRTAVPRGGGGGGEDTNSRD